MRWLLKLVDSAPCAALTIHKKTDAAIIRQDFVWVAIGCLPKGLPSRQCFFEKLRNVRAPDFATHFNKQSPVIGRFAVGRIDLCAARFAFSHHFTPENLCRGKALVVLCE